MLLSRAERQLLLSVAVSEEGRNLNKLLEALGIRHRLEDLVLDDQAASAGPTVVPTHIRVPFAAILAPERFKQVVDEYKKRYGAIIAAGGAGEGLVEVGTLSTEEAKDFFKNL